MGVSLTVASWTVGDTADNPLKAFDYICHGYDTPTQAQAISLQNVSAGLLKILRDNFPANKLRYVQQPGFSGERSRYTVILVRNDLDLEYYQVIDLTSGVNRGLWVDVMYKGVRLRIFSLDFECVHFGLMAEDWSKISKLQLQGSLPVLCGNFSLHSLNILEQWKMKQLFRQMGVRNLFSYSADAHIAIPRHANVLFTGLLHNERMCREKMVITGFELD